MTKVALKWARLANTENQKIAHIRWMGCRIAVYDMTSPSESGVKVRKNRCQARGKNRRGRRSHRGGRKRRALAGAAPETPKPSFSTCQVSNRAWTRRSRTTDYSMRLVALVKAGIIKRNKLTTRRRNGQTILRHADGTFFAIDDAIEIARKYVRDHRRKWFKLRKETHPGEPSFSACFSFDIELGENARYLAEALSKAPPPVIVSVPPTHHGSNVMENNQGFYCSNCMRATPATVCRICGAGLSHPDRKLELIHAKAARERAKASEQSAPPLVTRPKGKGRPSPRR